MEADELTRPVAMAWYVKLGLVTLTRLLYSSLVQNRPSQLRRSFLPRLFRSLRPPTLTMRDERRLKARFYSKWCWKHRVTFESFAWFVAWGTGSTSPPSRQRRKLASSRQCGMDNPRIRLLCYTLFSS